MFSHAEIVQRCREGHYGDLEIVFENGRAQRGPVSHIELRNISVRFHLIWLAEKRDEVWWHREDDSPFVMPLTCWHRAKTAEDTTVHCTLPNNVHFRLLPREHDLLAPYRVCNLLSGEKKRLWWAWRLRASSDTDWTALVHMARDGVCLLSLDERTMLYEDAEGVLAVT
jgi:hypothetical protein